MTPRDWNEMKKLLGDRADQETLDAVKDLVEGIETNLKGSLTANVVKSVQIHRLDIAKNTTTASLTISEVNPSKAFVITGGSIVGRGWRIEDFTETSISFYCSDASSYISYLSIQVIEFY